MECPQVGNGGLHSDNFYDEVGNKCCYCGAISTSQVVDTNGSGFDQGDIELGYEFDALYDSVRERFAGTEEIGDDWYDLPNAEEREAVVAAEAEDITQNRKYGSVSHVWFPNPDVQVADDDCPF